MDKENKAKELIEEIKALGFTQIQIAEEILVSPVTVARWKNGNITAPPRTLKALRDALEKFKERQDDGQTHQGA